MRFIQVGVGGFGGVWVNVLKNDKRAKVVAMVDVNPQNLEKACAQAGYDESVCFSSLEDALKSVEADALVCVTPPALHRKPVVTALHAGLHVISEKPMAESMADCKAMLTAARESKKHYVVSQNYRYSDCMYTIADLIRKGRIGAIGQVKVDFFKGVNFDGFRSTMPYPLLVDMSIHHVDLMRFLTGLNPVSVRGQAWNPSWSHYKGDCSSSVVFEMSGGAHVLYNGSWCAQGDYSDWNGNWLIEGTKGAIRYQSGVITLNEVGKGYAVKKSQEVTPKKMKKGGQAFVLDNVIRCIGSGERPQTDVFDNIHSVAMIFAAVQAVKTGKKIAVIDPALKKMIGDR